MREKSDNKLSLKEKVYERIKANIINNSLKQGQIIKIHDLSEEMNLSRTPIREAFQILISEGYLDYIPNKGAIVRKIGLPELIEISQTREALEGMATKLACHRIDQNILASLEKKIKDKSRKIGSKKDENLLILYGDQLHDEILKACENDMIKNIINRLKMQFHSIGLLAVRTVKGRIKYACKEHLEIISALKNKDADFAEVKMRNHIKNVINDLIKSQLY